MFDKKVLDDAKKLVDFKKPTAEVAPGEPFHVSLNLGGQLTIRGSGFGSSGMVTVSGRQLHVTAWGANEITGSLPADVPSGEVVVHLDGATKRRGLFTRG
jgi:hypothetical protein